MAILGVLRKESWRTRKRASGQGQRSGPQVMEAMKAESRARGSTLVRWYCSDGKIVAPGLELWNPCLIISGNLGGRGDADWLEVMPQLGMSLFCLPSFAPTREKRLFWPFLDSEWKDSWKRDTNLGIESNQKWITQYVMRPKKKKVEHIFNWFTTHPVRWLVTSTTMLTIHSFLLTCSLDILFKSCPSPHRQPLITTKVRVYVS